MGVRLPTPQRESIESVELTGRLSTDAGAKSEGGCLFTKPPDERRKVLYRGFREHGDHHERALRIKTAVSVGISRIAFS